MKKILDWEKYLSVAAQAAAEGIVMLENKNHALPLDDSEEIALFGRMQTHYYKSGTGSGGMVNVSHVIDIPEGLKNAGIRMNQKLADFYQKWEEQFPYESGSGWSGEPWSQKEAVLEESFVKEIAESCKIAVVIIARTAGEEQDHRLEKGSYLLTDAETDMIRLTRKYFQKLIILLNTGNLIDLHFIDEYQPDAVLYIWQGGMIGGTGAAKVLTGEISPCGKLPDTIAYKIQDYPSDSDFGNQDTDFYTEDIYVGYRFFETMGKEKVRYPFGYGLSYTRFEIKSGIWHINEETQQVEIHVAVTNIGNVPGKEVIQIYCKAPHGKLDKPARVLTAFQKTKTLAPGETQEFDIPLIPPVSYDDKNITEYPYCNVLEAGEYQFYIGSDVRNAKHEASIVLSETVASSKKKQCLAPVQAFNRMTNNQHKFEPVPLRKYEPEDRILENQPEEFPPTQKKSVLADVLHGHVTMEEFIAQFSDVQLMQIICGEGMGSPRVTPGTAAAFGGVTDDLISYGIPAACCADGPSGIRMDSGTEAFSLPIGTMLASTFNPELITELFSFVGMELAANQIDCLLAPGMNIHRHPLNGRNFEYFSEDPLLTGIMACAELKGLHQSNVTGTLKHFCANNQETNRHMLNSVVSERALREIYLRGFEIAVKEGSAKSIMTTYGLINDIRTPCNYDLCTEILRHEWGFTGFVMTDWWTDLNSLNTEKSGGDLKAMIHAQNDIYMVSNDFTELLNGTFISARSQLQRNAANLCNFLMHTNAMKRLLGEETEIEIINRPDQITEQQKEIKFYELDAEITIDLHDVKVSKGSSYSFGLHLKNTGWYEAVLTASSKQNPRAQMTVTLFCMGTAAGSFTWNGTKGNPVSQSKLLPMLSEYSTIRLYFAQNGLDLHQITFRKPTVLKIPEGIQTIESMEYFRKYIEKVIIPDTVSRIGEDAFSYCFELKEVIFENPKGQKQDTVIEENAFSNCSISQIIIPEGVTTIKKNAFYGCARLKSVFLPASLTEIHPQAFRSCFELKEVHVSSENPEYVSVDGVLYDKNRETLIYWPCNKTPFQLPETVTGIEHFACNGINQKSIVIPDNVLAIGNSAFFDAETLEELIIPDTVIYIGKNICGASRFRSSKILLHRNGIEVLTYKNLLSDVLHMIDKKDFSILCPSIRRAVALQMFLKDPCDFYVNYYIKKHVKEVFFRLIRKETPEAMQYFLTHGDFITKENIDEIILYAIEKKKSEMQVLLTDYKNTHIGYDDSETIIKRKFAL